MTWKRQSKYKYHSQCCRCMHSETQNNLYRFDEIIGSYCLGCVIVITQAFAKLMTEDVVLETGEEECA